MNNKIQDDSAVIEEMSAGSEKKLAATEKMKDIGQHSAHGTKEVIEKAINTYKLA